MCHPKRKYQLKDSNGSNKKWFLAVPVKLHCDHSFLSKGGHSDPVIMFY